MQAGNLDGRTPPSQPVDPTQRVLKRSSERIAPPPSVGKASALASERMPSPRGAAPPLETMTPSFPPVPPLLVRLTEIAEENLPPTNKQSKVRRLFDELNAIYWDGGPMGMTNESLQTIAKANERLNRYPNILPYNHNIWMYRHPALPENFYLNASSCETGNRLYVSTQGPLYQTWKDFLSAVVVSGCRVVLTLVNPEEDNKPKTEPWWDFCRLRMVLHDGYTIEMMDEAVFTPEGSVDGQKLITRRFMIRDKSENEIRIVTQLHYVNWKDHGAPYLPLLHDMQDRIDRLNPGLTPIVGHCSAGCGRTGTWIIVDILWRKIKAQLAAGVPVDKVEIDIEGEILKLRHIRPQMIQSSAQLKAIYASLLERLRAIAKS